MASFVITFAALAALLAILRIFRSYFATYPVDNLPGPPVTSFFFGSLQRFRHRQGWKTFAEAAETYGPVSILRGIMGRRIVLIHDPKALHTMLVKDQEFLQKGIAPATIFTFLIGPGVFSTRGPQHRRQRKLLNPVFSVTHIRNMTHIFYGVAHKLEAAIRDRLPKDGSADVIDMNGWNGRTTLEMLGQAGLGYSFDNFVDDRADAYGDSLKMFFPALARVKALAFIVETLSYVFSTNAIRRLLRLLPHRDVQRTLDISDTLIRRSQEIIDERKVALRKGDDAMLAQVGEGKDIMSICLKANMAATPGEQMTDEEILAQTSTFILAGMDTTSNALSRILHQLSLHLDVQNKLRAEIVEATAGGTTDLDYDALMKLPYLDAICRETLRLYSPVTLSGRTATKDVVLPFSEPIRGRDGTLMNEVVVNRGVSVFAHFQASNSNKALWGEDADEWKPERWLKPFPSVLEEAHIPGVYSNLMTFSGGLRSCIGFKFSQIEMKIVLSVLLNNFSFELTDEPIMWNSSAVIYPTMGLKSTKPEMRLKVKAL